MSLIAHAQDELKRVGLFDEDSDYGGMLGKAVMELITVFANQGHSGASANMVSMLFNQLVNYRTLSPLTSNPDEWVEVADNLWQNKRNPAAFSTDGGQTWKVD